MCVTNGCSVMEFVRVLANFVRFHGGLKVQSLRRFAWKCTKSWKNFSNFQFIDFTFLATGSLIWEWYGFVILTGFFKEPLEKQLSKTCLQCYLKALNTKNTTNNAYCSVNTTSLLVDASLHDVTATRYFSSALHLESLKPLKINNSLFLVTANSLFSSFISPHCIQSHGHVICRLVQIIPSKQCCGWS